MTAKLAKITKDITMCFFAIIVSFETSWSILAARNPVRILSFTGGAGQMYCGSCLRDNALASALIARGHDVVLTPVYTPTRTDERNVSQHHVVFGGISVFLEQHSSIFRHTPRVLDRLWDAEWVIKLASKRQIKVDPQSLGEMTVSMLRGDHGFQTQGDREAARLAARPSRGSTSSTCPTRCSSGLAEPLQADSGHADLLHAAG